MARPHTLFVQSQFLPWNEGVVGGARNDVQVKTLSMDAGDGSCSLIIRYPRRLETHGTRIIGRHRRVLRP